MLRIDSEEGFIMKSVLIFTFVVCTAMACFGQTAQDEPAIHRDVPSLLIPEGCSGEGAICSNDLMVCSHHGVMNLSATGLQFGKCVNGWVWDCEDQGRILMIAQNGDTWCHKPVTIASAPDLGEALRDKKNQDVLKRYFDSHCHILQGPPSTFTGDDGSEKTVVSPPIFLCSTWDENEDGSYKETQ
jgi:hypothetical protein